MRPPRRTRPSRPERAAAEVSGEVLVGPDDGPERTCVVTRGKAPPEALIRFVVSPDRVVVPDIRARLPGRGAWVRAERAAVAEAVRRKSFPRAFKAEVGVPPDLADAVDSLLERDALQALAMANKAGLVVAGAAKIEDGAGKRVPRVLVHASDGAADGTRKLEAALRRRLGDGAAAIERVQIFSSSQLDLALGRTNVIHASLAVGTISDGFTSRSRRLARYRGYPQNAIADIARSIEDERNEDRGHAPVLDDFRPDAAPGRTTDE